MAPRRYITVAPRSCTVAQKRDAENCASNTAEQPMSAACAKVLSALMWNSGSVVHSTSSLRTPRIAAVFTPHQ